MTPSLAPGLQIGPAPPATASPGLQSAGASSKSTSSKTSDQSPQDAFAALLQTATQEAAGTQGGGEPTGPPTRGTPSTPEDTPTVSDLLAQLMALAQGLPDEGETTDSTASTEMTLLLDRLAEAGGPEANADGTSAFDASGAVEALMAYLVMAQPTQTDPDPATALPADLVALLQQIEGTEGTEGVTTDLEPVVQGGATGAAGAEAGIGALDAGGALAGESETPAVGEIATDVITGPADAELTSSQDVVETADVTPELDEATGGVEVSVPDAGQATSATAQATPSGSGQSEAATELNAADAVAAAEAAVAAQSAQSGQDASDGSDGGDASSRPQVTGTAGATSGVENAMAAAATASQPAVDATVVETAGATRVVTTATLPAEVADSVRTAAFRGDSEVRLVLNPPELGHLDIHISRGEHGLRIVMEASQAGARELLDRSMTGLHQALEARDVRVDRLEVRATDTGRGSLDTSAGGQQPGGGGFNGSQGEDTPEWSPVAMFESMNMPATEPEQTSAGGARDGVTGSVDVLA